MFSPSLLSLFSVCFTKGTLLMKDQPLVTRHMFVGQCFYDCWLLSLLSLYFPPLLFVIIQLKPFLLELSIRKSDQ